MTAATHNADFDTNAIQRAILLNYALQDACASVVYGGFCPNLSAPAGNQTPEAVERSYVRAATRCETMLEGTKKTKKLFQEYEKLLGGPAMADLTRVRFGEKASAVVARAQASKKLFARECGLVVGENELLLPEGNGTPPSDKASLSSPETTSQTEPVAVGKRVLPLMKLLDNIRELRRCPGFHHEAQLRKEHQDGSGPSKPVSYTKHIERLVSLLEEAVDESTLRLRATYASCPKSAILLAEVANWPAEFLRLVNESLQSPSLVRLTDDVNEQLRRIAFDAEELQHEQQQAVTDGDMQKSEELYFQQTGLLETMKPHFDRLEAILLNYKRTYVEQPTKRLQAFNQQFRTRLQQAMQNEQALQRRATADIEALEVKRKAILHVRDVQASAVQAYSREWEKLYDGNVQQQIACFRAMEELELRVKQLADEQAFLVEDRLQHIREECHRKEDAETFFHFASARQQSLQNTLANLEVVITSMQKIGTAIGSSSQHYQMYVNDVIDANAEAELLDARKRRLDQFRTLYLTLGELHFKKVRHAEEIEKKIEYYTLQQEVAMDTLNPKAKEYSKARQNWQTVKDELHQQIKVLEKRSECQLLEFKPTAQHLGDMGVEFVHPQVELEERNKVREQKLLEYKRLMEGVAQEDSSKSPAGGSV